MPAMNLAVMQCRAEGRIAAGRGEGQDTNPYGDALGRAWHDGFRAHFTEVDELTRDDEIEPR